MLYYIAFRNKETDKFELKTINGETKVYSDLNEAIDVCATAMKFNGVANTLLLKEVILDVTFGVKCGDGLNG